MSFKVKFDNGQISILGADEKKVVINDDGSITLDASRACTAFQKYAAKKGAVAGTLGGAFTMGLSTLATLKAHIDLKITGESGALEGVSMSYKIKPAMRPCGKHKFKISGGIDDKSKKIKIEKIK